MALAGWRTVQRSGCRAISVAEYQVDSPARWSHDCRAFVLVRAAGETHTWRDALLQKKMIRLPESQIWNRQN